MSDVLTPETFDFVLANELKRAARSQNFVTLVEMAPRTPEGPDAVQEIARVVSHELRETDLLGTSEATVSMVLLDTDLQNSDRVIDRVMSRLEHYQFTAPVDIEVGAACCPTHGSDIDSLRRAAAAARKPVPRHGAPGSTAQAQ